MYAKDYFTSTKFIDDSGLCFVLMPFAPGFNEVWNTIRETVSGSPFNLKVLRADDVDSPGYILTTVWENIGKARLVIADLSGQNPNVFYEVGIAHSFKNKEQVILISRDQDSIPFDLRQLRTIIYNNDLDKLKSSLTDTITELGIRQYDIIIQEGETKKFPARLTGDDHCLYEIEIFTEYIGDDGVKIALKLIKFEIGKNPKTDLDTGFYLGISEPAIKIPNMPWSVCYKSIDTKQVRFILGRPPGWQPK